MRTPLGVLNMANANSGGHVGYAGAHRSGVCDPEATTSTYVPSLREAFDRHLQVQKGPQAIRLL